MKKEDMYPELSKLRIYKLAENLSDEIWDIVDKWKYFEKDTLGNQLVRAVDSIGANIAEGYGRHHHREFLNFLYFARGSLYETQHWLNRAMSRNLIDENRNKDINNKLLNLLRQLNSFIQDRKKRIDLEKK